MADRIVDNLVAAGRQLGVLAGGQPDAQVGQRAFNPFHLVFGFDRAVRVQASPMRMFARFAAVFAAYG
ncbi:MAG: hypothetical protein U0736_10365 [Gemmataceae bacterium]